MLDCFSSSCDSRLTYASAAHPFPLLRSKNGKTKWLNQATGLPLGAFPDVEYSEEQIELESGDSLLLYTDGVIEAHSGNKWFGAEDLELLLGKTDARPSELVDIVYRSVSESIGESVPDDVALVAVRMGT